MRGKGEGRKGDENKARWLQDKREKEAETNEAVKTEKIGRGDDKGRKRWRKRKEKRRETGGGKVRRSVRFGLPGVTKPNLQQGRGGVWGGRGHQASSPIPPYRYVIFNLSFLRDFHAIYLTHSSFLP
ncbi:hypothetical protein E2C01_031178 [Portunus trituberculatus]|uniref:Uncharacterized protein n=1 Tax=Portunus trituberculatus TaxID=210409 RepID=A0A5B7EXE8_PORTR|nr:hypothetical protein [Portunus trituberculatus]